MAWPTYGARKTMFPSNWLPQALFPHCRTALESHLTCTAAIVMEDHLVDVTVAAIDCHRECSTHEFGAHVVVHGVANEVTRSEVEHAGEKEPSFVGPNVGDVPAGSTSRFADAEVASHEVRERGRPQVRRPQVRNRRAHLLASRVGGVEAVGANQSFHAFVVGEEAPRGQLVGETR